MSCQTSGEGTFGVPPSTVLSRWPLPTCRHCGPQLHHAALAAAARTAPGRRDCSPRRDAAPVHIHRRNHARRIHDIAAPYRTGVAQTNRQHGQARAPRDIQCVRQDANGTLH